MKRINFNLFITMAMLMLSFNSAWAQYVKVTAEDGSVSWIEIAGTINGANIEIYGWSAIDQDTKGSINLNEVWSQRGAVGTHYQVTGIGFGAFYDCSGLTSICIPSSVQYIDDYAFWGCGSLKKVIIKDIVAWCYISFGYDDANPLLHARHLYSDENTEITKLIIPSYVSDRAFSGCSGLISVEIPSRGVEIGEGAFDYCNGLKNVIVKDIAALCNSSFGGYGANPLSYAHHLYSDENTEITKLIIPSSVTSIGNYAFDGCSSLTSIDIPSSVTSISDYALTGCSGLTSVDIPSSVTSIGNYAFDGCSGLTSVVIPSSVTSIGDYVLSGCSGLTTITSYITDIFETGKDAFTGCENATLYVPKGLTNFYRITTDWNRFKKIEEMQEVTPGTIVVSCNNKGNVKINGTTEFTNNVGEVDVFDGMDNTFTFQPNNNCELRQVLIDGLDVTLSVENNQLTTKVHVGSKMIVIFDKTGSDVNGDGQVNISDVVALVNLILGQ